MATLNCGDGTVIKISDETEKELRKAFGKKLKHGDYGFWHGSELNPCVVYKVGEDFRVLSRNSLQTYNMTNHEINRFDVRGNVFDYLRDIV